MMLLFSVHDEADKSCGEVSIGFTASSCPSPLLLSALNLLSSPCLISSASLSGRSFFLASVIDFIVVVTKSLVSAVFITVVVLLSTPLRPEKILFTARTAASFASALRSAPTKPCVSLAILLKSKSPARRIPLHTTLRIFERLCASGIPIVISLSNRPALRRAESKESGRFVAATTMTGRNVVVVAVFIDILCSVMMILPSSSWPSILF
mmetsp:Transcript_24658/g.39566  ORF Transcript_24658/g.39566 Transcript_24658/m.39566 type:complete len:209 (-) Transcript_24658:244-870(-)